MGYFSATTTFLYYLLYPIAIFLVWILSLLRILAAPFLYLGHYVMYACWYPFHVLGKFETLYVFFGVATLVGILTGTSLHYLSGFIGTFLNLEGEDEEPRGRTLAAYRTKIKEKHKQKQEDNVAILPTPRYTPQTSVDASPKEEYMDWSRRDRRRKQGSLIGTTILEEEDSSEDGF